MDRIIAQNEEEFKRGVVSLKKADLAAIVNLIQREMTQEQDEFNRLTERLKSMDAKSRDYAYLEKARLQSQVRLTSLMNKSMICLARKEDISTSAESPEPPPAKTALRTKKEAPRSPKLEPCSLHGTATLSSSVRLAEAGDTRLDGRAKVRFSCPENGAESSPKAVKTFSFKTATTNSNNNSADTVEAPKNDSHTVLQAQQSPRVPPQSPPGQTNGSSSAAPPQNGRATQQNAAPSQNGPATQKNAAEESPPPTPSARSLIANFERLNSSTERAPRRSASTADFAAASRSPGIPHSASMAQLPVKRVEIVERAKEAPRPKPQEPKPQEPKSKPQEPKFKPQEAKPQGPKLQEPKPQGPKPQEPKSKPLEARRSAPAKPPPVREVEIVRSSTSSQNSKPPEAEKIVRKKDEVDGRGERADGDIKGNSPGVVIGDEKVQPTPTLKLWDPTKLLTEMFQVRLVEEEPQPSSANACSGVLDKLPDQKKKNTMLKTWKRRYFVADQGELRTFEAGVTDPSTAAPVQVFQLSGGRVDDLGELMIGIDDGCGRFVTLRCPTSAEHSRWLRALELQASSEHRPHHVIPILKTAPHPSRQVLIVDIGSFGIRAGTLKEASSLPDLHFPSLAAIRSGEVVAVGHEAFLPSVRSQSQLVAPAKADTTIENVAFERGILKAIFLHIFRELKLEPKQTTVLLSVPNTTSDHTRGRLCELMFGELQIASVAICGQAILALYAYGLTTGVVVDLGHRMEILPVTDGVVQKGGVARQPFGGARIAEGLNLHLSERGFRFFSEAELLLTRFVLRQAAYVCQDPDVECDVTNAEEAEVDLSQFDLPPDYRQSVSLLANGRCRCTEGLFNPQDYFGLDSPSLPRLVQRAIVACPMDLRRDLAKRIVLSGGATLLPGFSERLHRELTKLLPAASQVKVHAAPNRLHASFLGATRLAAMAEFDAQCVTRQQWGKSGQRAIMGKWTV